MATGKDTLTAPPGRGHGTIDENRPRPIGARRLRHPPKDLFPGTEIPKRYPNIHQAELAPRISGHP